MLEYEEDQVGRSCMDPSRGYQSHARGRRPLACESCALAIFGEGSLLMCGCSLDSVSGKTARGFGDYYLVLALALERAAIYL